MWNILFWLYITNAALIIVHEIDSAFWKEWNLFRKLFKGLDPDSEADNKGINGFLLSHIPALFIFLYGIVPVSNQAFSGLILSLLLCGCGIFAFTIHMLCLKKGFKEFGTPVSISILIGTGIVSVIQLIITILLFVK